MTQYRDAQELLVVARRRRLDGGGLRHQQADEIRDFLPAHPVTRYQLCQHPHVQTSGLCNRDQGGTSLPRPAVLDLMLNLDDEGLNWWGEVLLEHDLQIVDAPLLQHDL